MRSTPRDCFVDTSAYFVLANARDVDHVATRALLQRLAIANTRFYTSNFILAETHALLLKRLNRAIAATFVGRIYASATTIVRVSESDEERAWTIITQYNDKNFTFADATSFAVMERLRISHAFTLDADFRQYGFPIVSSATP